MYMFGILHNTEKFAKKSFRCKIQEEGCLKPATRSKVLCDINDKN
jgi:hypothetical protein